MVSKICPIIGEHIVIIFVTQLVTIATRWSAKTPLTIALSTYISKWHGETPFFFSWSLISMIRFNFRQRLKKILYMEFIAVLMFWKLREWLNWAIKILVLESAQNGFDPSLYNQDRAVKLWPCYCNPGHIKRVLKIKKTLSLVQNMVEILRCFSKVEFNSGSVICTTVSI